MNSPHFSLPPALGEVFGKLNSGYHICIEDGDIYKSLAEHSNHYRELFKELGFKLSDGSDGIYYFIPTDKKINESSKRYTAFMAIMYDWLADQGKEPVTSLTEEHFYLDQLPHLSVDQYKKVMSQLDITEDKDLLNIVNKLQYFGFVNFVDGSMLKFRKTVSRFVTIFTEVTEREDEQRGEKNTNG